MQESPSPLPSPLPLPPPPEPALIALSALPLTLLVELFAPPPPAKKLSIGENRVLVHEEVAALPASLAALPDDDDERFSAFLGDLDLERCGRACLRLC